MEYAFGDGVNSHWGALRVKDGREQPYRPFVVEIGNENTLNHTAPEASPCRDGCVSASSLLRSSSNQARSLGRPYSCLATPVCFILLLCRCQNFTDRWIERAHAMDAKAHTLGIRNLTFVVGFDAGIGGGQSCSEATVLQSKASIVR